ncbi:MAG: hypothetical protein LBB75_06000, partial [Oscillospiraceae bacterium]|nr:hypothetical protein [Oscillospiraceae bacterium]
ADPTFSCQVEPGKKANSGISFFSSQLNDCRITDIGVIELKLILIDAATYRTIFKTDSITIETSAAGSVAQWIPNPKTVRYAGNGVTISSYKFNKNALFGPEILFFVENESDQPIRIGVRNVSVNGYMIDGYFVCDVLPGKKAVEDLFFFKSELTDNGITDIESVELKFDIYNSATFSTIVLTDLISIAWEKPAFAFTVAAGAGGTVSGTASGYYAQGAAISVTATADSGYHFKRWTVSSAALTSATANPAAFTMPAGAVTLTANFEADSSTAGKEYIELWGKETTWKNTFLNQILLFLFFGWIWMAF